MRKILLITTTMLILFLSAASMIYIELDKEKDNVTVTETVRYGDRSFAENIKVNFISNYHNSLFWNTEYTIGNEDSEKTKFNFYKTYRHNYDDRKFLNIYTSLSYDFHNRYNDIGINKAFNDLAKTAEPYVNVEKEILLSDYYEYYPYEIDVNFPGKISVSTDFDDILSAAHKEFVQAFRDFFKIPVVENHRMIINLMVNEDGEITQTGSADADNTSGDFSFYSDAAATKDEFFICFSNKTTTGLSVDTSKIPGGYGVYVLPFSENEKEATLDVKNLRNICPVDNENEIYSMFLSEDNKNLFVMIKNGNICKAFILDTDTYEKLGEFTIAENMTKEDYAYFQCIKENYALVTFYLESTQKEYYSVFTFDSSYNFKEEFTTEIYKTIKDETTNEDITCGTYPGSLSQAKFDGQYLYISADNIDSDYDKLCPHTGFTMVIYDKEGLVYHGDYDTSLSAGNDGNFNSSFYVNNNYEDIISFELP